MSDMQEFPENIMDFINAYSFKDRKQIYTNGSSLVPVFRVKQALEHYLKKLAHYEDLEGQGRLIELPCKVGDKVYFIYYNEIRTGTVTDFIVTKLHVGLEIKTDMPNKFYDDGRIDTMYIRSNYGEKTFLTKAEAEAKLKEMEKDNAR